MSILIPPPQDELELLIKEARARQRRRRMIAAAAVAVVAGVVLSLGATLPGRGTPDSASGGSAGGAASRGIDNAGRVPIVEVGSSGGVTWALNGLGIWVTTNGGRTWRASAPKHVRDTGDLRERVEQVGFLDGQHGWVFAVDVHSSRYPAGHAELDWTSDAGRTWHSTIPQGCCGAVSFAGPSHGWFLGPRTVMETTDAGATWAPVAREPFAYGTPTFVDAEHGIAVVGKGEVFRTSDGGRHWSPVRLPGHATPLPSITAYGRRLVLPAEQVAAGRLVVYASGDGGATWAARPAPRWWSPVIASEDAQQFSAVSSAVWYAVAGRRLLETTNAGASWRLVALSNLPRRWTITSIAFTSPRAGWGVFQLASPSLRSVLMRTTDGGRHWVPAGPRKPRRHKHG